MVMYPSCLARLHRRYRYTVKIAVLRGFLLFLAIIISVKIAVSNPKTKSPAWEARLFDVNLNNRHRNLLHRLGQECDSDGFIMARSRTEFCGEEWSLISLQPEAKSREFCGTYFVKTVRLRRGRNVLFFWTDNGIVPASDETASNQ